MVKKTINNEVQKEEITTSIETKYVKPIFVSGQNSSTIILPKKLAREHGLEYGSHVVIESTPNGILIRKIDLEEVLQKQ
jgi:Antidote-toxin recognition MazE, bacterial antitoxin